MCKIPRGSNSNGGDWHAYAMGEGGYNINIIEALRKGPHLNMNTVGEAGKMYQHVQYVAFSGHCPLSPVLIFDLPVHR